MDSSSFNLLLYYGGFGYVLFLIWAIVMSSVVHTVPPRWARTATTILQVVGIAHPASALAAWDLHRELARDPNEPNTPTGGGNVALVVASLLIAAVVVIATTRT